MAQDTQPANERRFGLPTALHAPLPPPQYTSFCVDSGGQCTAASLFFRPGRGLVLTIAALPTAGHLVLRRERRPVRGQRRHRGPLGHLACGGEEAAAACCCAALAMLSLSPLVSTATSAMPRCLGAASLLHHCGLLDSACKPLTTGLPAHHRPACPRVPHHRTCLSMLNVQDCIVAAGYVLHLGQQPEGEIKVGDAVTTK